MKAAFSDQPLIHDHLDPVYSRRGKPTIADPQSKVNSCQRPLYRDFMDWRREDFFFGSLSHDHDLTGNRPLVPTHLEVDAKLRRAIGERRGPDLGTDPTQVEHGLLTGALFDVIAQDQDVDAGEHRAVSHGRAPPDTGGAEEKRSIPPPNRRRNSDLPAEAGRSAAAARVAGPSSDCPP
jgi:hypothetical protein